MRILLGKIVLAVAVSITLAGTASAEVVKGKVKAIADDLKFFSMIIAQEKVLLIAWDNKTVWQGVSSSTELKLDENLTVEVFPSGESLVAASVSRVKAPLPAGIQVITLDRLVEELEGKGITLVDSRSVALYDAGHIPGAVSLPLSRLEKRTYGLLPANKSAKLVFYDEGQGGDSAGKAAGISIRADYSDVAILPEGAAVWVDSGKFLAASTNFIRKTKPVVIDIRPKEQVAQGHIPGAVNYPSSALKDYFAYLPTDKLAPIVLYGNADNEALAAAQFIRERGYRNITIYPGGADAWLKNAEVLELGPAEEESPSAAASHGGQLSPNDFKMALISPVMVEIVDVRSVTERKEGGFPQAKQIPLADLAKKHGELSREKIQVIFAADAGKAEMAYDFLRYKGYRVNYLNGSIKFGKDGEYTFK